MITFNVPKIIGSVSKDFDKLKNQKHFSSNGLYTKKCRSWLIKNLKCKDAHLVHSCTAALEMCALLLNIKPGDEVIMPSFTFVSTANAFALRGAKISFVDINPNTLNIEPNLIEKNITKKTKAIVIVHYAGVSCDMDKILKISKKYKICLIEDAAQSILSKFKNKALGSLGDLATFSFHETKNIHCGEGGALIINNQKFIRQAYIIRDKGTNRNEFNKKFIKKYSWVGIGSSYGLSEINSFFLYNQLKNSKIITDKRLRIWKLYKKYFRKFEIDGKILTQTIPSYSKINGHSFFIIVKKSIRNKIIKYLQNNKVMALFHYVPLHNSPYGKKITKSKNKLKVTDLKASSIIRMPLHLDVTKNDIIRIKNLLTNFFNKYHKETFL